MESELEGDSQEFGYIIGPRTILNFSPKQTTISQRAFGVHSFKASMRAY